MPIRTLDFDALVLAGTELTVKRGRLLITTPETGRRSWRATAVLHEIPDWLPGAGTHDVRLVTRKGARFNGTARVEPKVTVSGVSTKVGIVLISSGDFSLTEP